MNLEGRIIRLRAVEPRDIEAIYRWENDTDIWSVSGTTAPFSRHTLERFIAEQRFDIYQTRQLRLIIEDMTGEAVGALDLFDFDPHNGHAGVGILIHDKSQRGKGYASDALGVACRYARTTLGLRQLWCNVGSSNKPSLALFSKAGFCEVGIKCAWRNTPTGYEDEVFMQKFL